MKCWGGNSEGSLGLGDLLDRGAAAGEMGDNLPVVGLTFGDGLGAVSNIFAGRFHTCVSGTEGGMACYGLNAGAQLGAGTSDVSLGDAPSEVEAISSINLGSDAVVSVASAPGASITLETISPTPLETMSPMPSETISPTPILTFAVRRRTCPFWFMSRFSVFNFLLVS